MVLALLGAGVRSDFAPQLGLDAVVSEALYAGDHRAGALNGLLEVLTAPGLSWFRFLVFLPVLVLLVRRRSWWTAAWLVTAVVLIGPLNTLLQELLRAGAARLRRGRRAVRLAELPERPLVGHRHPRHRRADPGLAAARRAGPGTGRSPPGSCWSSWSASPACGSACTSSPTSSAAGRSASAGRLLTALLFGALAEGRAALRPTA